MEIIISDILDFEPLVMRFVADKGTNIETLNDLKNFLQKWFENEAENPTENSYLNYWNVFCKNDNIVEAHCEFITEDTMNALSEIVSKKYPQFKKLILGLEMENAQELDEISWLKLEKGEIDYNNERVLVESCLISKYHITIEQFYKFLDETGYITDKDKKKNNSFRKSQETVPGRREMQWPVTSVTYYDAIAFCNWIGGRLPTEVELYHFFHEYFKKNQSFPFIYANWTNTKKSENQIILIQTPATNEYLAPLEEMLLYESPSYYSVFPTPSIRVCKDIE